MNRLLLCGGILGFISVVMGAVADHAIEITPDKIDSMETAIRYNMAYAILIVVLSLAPSKKGLRASGRVFLAGIICFSFSIYFSIVSGIHQLTFITPIGGILLMVGWLKLIFIAAKNQQ